MKSVGVLTTPRASLPMHELIDTDQEARAVFGAWVNELEQRLGESRSFEDRIRIANTFSLSCCARLQSPDEITAAAMSVLYQQGSIQVPALAQQAGMSTRQFERRFTREIGMPPKLFARIARFEAALESKAVDCQSWTDVANQLGYFDQMHLIHDFKEFSGELPTTLLTQLEMNLDTHLDGIRSSQIALTPREAPQLIL
jgi:AraC-like DNA-binding protein